MSYKTWSCPVCGLGCRRPSDEPGELCAGSEETPHEPTGFVELVTGDPVRDARTDRAFVSAADIEPTAVRWLWRPYLSRGVVTLLGGDGGVGKSTVTAKLAAAVSAGDEFPDGWKPMSGEPAGVLIMNAEDDLQSVLIPRLIAASADLERVTVVDLSVADHLAVLDERTFEDLDRNLGKLRPRLVVVDPIVAFMGDGRDMNRANEIRPMIRELGNLAARYDCAVLVVGHLNKNESSSATNRLSGSVDFRNAARSLMLAGKVDDEPDRGFAIFHNKSNYAELAGPLGYRFTTVDDVVAVEWQATDLTEPEVFGGKQPKVAKTQTATDVIRAFLQEMPGMTAAGAHVTAVVQAALGGNVAAGTMQKARDAASVTIIRHGDGATDWQLIDLSGAVRTPAKPMRVPANA